MTDRVPLNCRVDEDVIEDFRDFTHEAKGKIRGEMGRLVERAMIEYMDHDRAARLEEDHEELFDRLDTLEAALRGGGPTHTHTNTGGSETVEKTRRIVSRLQRHHDDTCKRDDVERAIEDIAGGDERTLEKYLRQLKRRGHAFEHPLPQSPVWFLDDDTWLEVLVNQDVRFNRSFFETYPDKYWNRYRGRLEGAPEQEVAD